MSAVAPGWKLRVLLAQALFAEPDIMLLDEPTNNLDIDTIRWLEGVLHERKCTMIIISHDRHFLNTVCTHMADLDYGELRVFPGNYDEYMTAATQARERMYSENAKKKAQIADLQAFVSRFSANASKSRQATSRARQIEKIVLEEVKPSSRMSPYIRFEQDKKLHRLAVHVEKLTQELRRLGTCFATSSLTIQAGERVAVVGTNGIGKTTLLRCVMSELAPDARHREVGGERRHRLHAARPLGAFESNTTVFDWMRARGQPRDDDQAIRAVARPATVQPRRDESRSVDKLSGGERGRMLFGKIMLQRPNVIVMDEPTNHLDMESIESLNLALENYPGTLIFVSHDREFVARSRPASSRSRRAASLTSAAATTITCAPAGSAPARSAPRCGSNDDSETVVLRLRRLRTSRARRAREHLRHVGRDVADLLRRQRARAERWHVVAAFAHDLQHRVDVRRRGQARAAAVAAFALLAVTEHARRVVHHLAVVGVARAAGAWRES